MTDDRFINDVLAENIALTERLRVLTEQLNAAEIIIGALPDDVYADVKRESLAGLRGVLDDHPRPLYGESLLDLVDGPLAGERRRVSGLWGTHVAFSRAGVQYQYNADGTFDRELGEVGESV